MGSKFEWGGAYQYLHYVLRYALRLHWVQNTASTGMSVAREAHRPKATRGEGVRGAGRH